MSDINNKFLGQVVGSQEVLPHEPDIKPADSYKYDVGFGDVLGRSFKNDSLIAIGVNNVMLGNVADKFMVDDKFNATEEFSKYDSANIHDDFKDRILSEAKNKEHLDVLMNHYEKESAYQRELESYGFGSQILMGLLPEATNAPLYVGAAAMLPQTAAMMGSSALLRFATSGTAGAAIEGLKDVLGEQDKHALDYAGAVIFDGALGSALGKRTKGSFNQIANDMVLRSHGITKEVQKQVLNAKTKVEKNAIIENAYFKFSGKSADKTLLDVLDDNVEYASQNIAQRAWSSVRQDLAYVTGLSDSPTMSTFSKKMFPDATLQNLDLNNPDMSSDRDLLESVMRTKRQTIFSPLIKEYTRLVHNSGGLFGIKPTGMQELEFSELLGKIQRERSLDKTLSKEDAVKIVMNSEKLPQSDELTTLLLKGADGMENLALDYHKVLGENGHSDFADGIIQPDGTYMPFVYNKESIARLRNKGVKEGDIVKFFKSAIRNNFDDDYGLDEESVNLIAMAFYKAVSEQNIKRLNTFDSILDEILEQNKNSFELREAIEKIKKPRYNRGGEQKGQFAEQRTNLDYSHKESFKIDGSTEYEISFRDFISTDYLNNMDTYARRMSGTTVMRKYGWDIDARIKDINEIKREDYSSEKKYLHAYNKRLSDNKKAADEIRSEILQRIDIIKLREVVDGLEGKNLSDGLELLRDISSRLGKSVEDVKVRTAIDDALADNDFNRVANIIFEEIQKAGGKTSGIDANLRNNINWVNSLKADQQNNMAFRDDIKFKKVLEAIENGTVRVKKVSDEFYGERITYEEVAPDTKGLLDEADTKRLFELIDEFVTGHQAKLEKAQNDLDVAIKKAEDIEIAKAMEPTEFRLKTRADYDEFREVIRKELEEGVKSNRITRKEADKDLVRLDTILKDMSGIATSKDPNGNLNKLYRITHSYNIGRLLGQTFFTMPAEAMNVMWDTGLKSFIESMPAIKSLLRAYKNGNIDNAQAREIQDALGMYDEFLSSPRLYEFDHEFNAVTGYHAKANKAVDKIEAWGENFAEFTLMTGGIKPLTAWFQTAHVMGVFKKMRNVAEGGTPDKNYRKTIRELGLSEEMEEAVYKQIRKNYDNGTMNFDKWDTDVKNVFLVGVKRRTDTLVQMQRLGDKPAWVSEPDYMLKDTFTGKVAMELKQFVMTAYVKQLGRALNRKDQYMIGLIASQMTALTLSYMMKQTLNYAGNEEKFNKAMEPVNIVAGTMGMMPQGSVMPMVMNFGSQMMFGRNLMGTSRHNSQMTDMISSLPLVDGISRVMQAFSIPSEVLTGEFDNKTLKPVASLTGVSNHWLTKALYESTQNK